ncbi:MAG: efflux RND transporter permease subunit [Bacteroidia bacterium]
MKLLITALRKPVTILVLVLGMLFFAVLSVTRIPIDIFPKLDLPVIYVAQPYGGMSPQQMEGFIATRYQDQFLYVSGIKNIDVKNIQGLALLRLSFYPGTDMAQAAAEVSTQVSRARAQMPSTTLPPIVVRFDASSLPVGQLVFKSAGRSLNELQDLASTKIRPMFASIPGVSSPPPFGGNARTIVIKADPDLMRSHNITPDEMVKALADNNSIAPAGNVRIGDIMYITPSNSVIEKVPEFGNIPILKGNGPTVFMHDIATVEDGADVTSGYALVNGKRAVYIPVTKRAEASTWDVVKGVKSSLPLMQSLLPEDVQISYEFDQSVYVINAVKSLITEGTLGALLTGLMVLLFLGDRRSALIVIITIPISILIGVLLLYAAGQTINIMTLSGLALAIGILVDMATVTIENIHQHLEMGKPKPQAILDACKEIAFPELLILFCILAVFAPSFLMSGIPKSMFLPLSLSVGFSMIVAFLIAQTLVPILANWMLKHNHTPENGSTPYEHPTLALSEKEENQLNKDYENEHRHPEKLGRFERFKSRYLTLLSHLLSARKKVIAFYIFLSFTLIGICFIVIGKDILPRVNSHQFQLRLKAPDGTRIERTEQMLLRVLDIINEEAGGKQNVEVSSAYVGLQPSSYATSNILVFNSGPHEAVLQVNLSEAFDVHMDAFKEKLRARIGKKLPALRLSFEPIDLTDKIMSQGSPTPIEVVVAGKDLQQGKGFAEKILADMKGIPYLRDVQIAQPIHYPVIRINIDRERAGQLGLTATEISKSLTAATSSSRFTEKNFWLDPSNGYAYQVQVEVPEYLMKDMKDLLEIPLFHGKPRPMLADVATLKVDTIIGEYDRNGPRRVITVTANIQGRDLASAAKDVQQVIDKEGTPPRGLNVEIKGLVRLLTETLDSLQSGLLLAIIVIFLMLTANFQSFKVSFIVLSSVPAVLAGSLIALLMSGSTLNLQSYMGIIMSVGVSVANAILLVTNAENLRKRSGNAMDAAEKSAASRIRPILMTSLAMIAGMIPMALGMGEAGEQTAPLGRAVIGGLFASTLATLLILPLIFTAVRAKDSTESASLDPEDENSPLYQLNRTSNND